MDSFVDLEKVRLEILQKKIQSGINEFKKNPGQQWTAMRLERPLLEKLLEIVEKEIKTQ